MFVVWCLLFIVCVRCLSRVVRCLPFVVCCAVDCGLSIVVLFLLFVVGCLLLVVC